MLNLCLAMLGHSEDPASWGRGVGQDDHLEADEAVA